MKKTSILNYIYSVGKIRSRESFLIKEEVLAEAIESDLAEALKLFVGADLFSEALLQVRDSQQLENVLDQELLNLKKLIGELILDKELLGVLELSDLEKIRQIIFEYGSLFLKNYIRHLIDLHNIKTFLRLYLFKETQEKLKAKMISGGSILKEDFLKLYTQDLAVFLHRLEYVIWDNRIFDYAFPLKEAIGKAIKENSFVALEKAINDFLMQILKPAKYISFGPEPVLAYYFAKVNEINLVRMIILSKLNNVSKDLVKERLNLVYA